MAEVETRETKISGRNKWFRIDRIFSGEDHQAAAIECAEELRRIGTTCTVGHYNGASMVTWQENRARKPATFEIGGKVMTVRQMAEVAGIGVHSMYERLLYGLVNENILRPPESKKDRRARFIRTCYALEREATKPRQ